MRRFAMSIALFVVAVTASCAFVLDTEELKKGEGEGGAAASAGTGGAAGGSGSAGAAGGQTVSLEELPASLAVALCSMLERCLGPAIEIYFGDEDCTEITTLSNEDGGFALIQQSLHSGRAVYDPEKAFQCMESFKELACVDFNRWAPICKEALKGLVPDGGECGQSVECAGAAYCNANESCPGTCLPKRKVGEECLFEEMCEDGLACFNSQCAERRREGAECKDDVLPECELGFLCLGQRDDKNGKCLSVEALFVSGQGIGCNVLAGPLCEDELYCALNGPMQPEGTCVGPALSGGDCSFSLPDPCPEGEYCRSRIGDRDVCTALPGANQPCAEGEFVRPCAAYHRCVNSVCKPMREIDEPCEDDKQCHSDFCDPASKTCKTPGGCQF